MTRRREKAVQPVGTRRAAREFVFRVLFEADRGDVPLQAVFTRAEGVMREGDDTFPQLGPDALHFAEELVTGLERNREAIDDVLHRTIRGWTFDQMAQTDLNVLRLATYELMYTPEPHPPVIESAVRIARKFGGDDSGRFVNGVLAGLSRNLREDAGESPAADMTAPAPADTAPADPAASESNEPRDD